MKLKLNKLTQAIQKTEKRIARLTIKKLGIVSLLTLPSLMSATSAFASPAPDLTDTAFHVDIASYIAQKQAMQAGNGIAQVHPLASIMSVHETMPHPLGTQATIDANLAQKQQQLQAEMMAAIADAKAHPEKYTNNSGLQRTPIPKTCYIYTDSCKVIDIPPPVMAPNPLFSLGAGVITPQDEMYGGVENSLLYTVVEDNNLNANFPTPPFTHPDITGHLTPNVTEHPAPDVHGVLYDFTWNISTNCFPAPYYTCYTHETIKWFYIMPLSFDDKNGQVATPMVSMQTEATSKNRAGDGMVVPYNLDPILLWSQYQPKLGADTQQNSAQTGNLFMTQTDVAGSIPFVRYYNSLQQVFGRNLGKYWQSEHDRRLVNLSGLEDYNFKDNYDVTQLEATAKEVLLQLDATGRVLIYTRDKVAAANDNTIPWQSYGDNKNKLMTHTDGSYQVRYADGSIDNYDSAGTLQKAWDVHHDELDYQYNNGHLAQISDPSGYELKFLYNTDGHLTQLVKTDGSTIDYTYDSHGVLATVTNGDEVIDYQNNEIKTMRNGQWVSLASYTFNTEELVASTTDYSKNVVTHFDYSNASVDGADGKATNRVVDIDEVRPIVTVTDNLGTNIQYTGHYANGALTKHLTQDSSINPQQVEHDANGNPTKVTDAQGGVTTMQYNNANQMVSVTKQGQTTTIDYLSPDLNLPTKITTNSLQTGVIMPNDVLTMTNQYDGKHQLISQTKGSPYSGYQTTTYIRDAKERVIEVDGPLNGSDKLFYTYKDCTTGGVDGCNRLASVSDIYLGHATQFLNYDALGRVTKTQDPNGLVTDYQYTGENLTQQTLTDPSTGSSRVINFLYKAGLLVQSTEKGVKTYYRYDDQGRVLKISNDLNQHIDYQYDNFGNRTAQSISDTGGLIRLAQYQYDNLNRLTDNVRQNGITEHFNYNKVNDLVSAIDGKGQTALTYQYDKEGRKIASIDVQGQTTQYSYDAHNNVSQIIAPNGAKTNFAYNDFDQVIAKASSDTSGSFYKYNGAGDMSEAYLGSPLDPTKSLLEQTPRGTHSYFFYDGKHNLFQAIYEGESIVYHRDQEKVGYLNQIDYTGSDPAYHGNQINYTHDNFGQVLTQNDVIDSQASTTGYQYDNHGNITQLSYPNGLVVNYGYNPYNQVTTVSATQKGLTTTIISQVRYDTLGNITGLTYGNGQTQAYSYDMDGQLTTLTGVINDSYRFDANQNIKSVTGNNNPASYSYDTKDRLVQDVQNRYGYDANSNMIVRGRTRLNYVANTNKRDVPHQVNDAGQTTTFDRGLTFTYNKLGRMATATQNGTLLASYTYNGLGQRIEKTLADNSKQLFRYDLQGHLINWDNQNYIWLGNLPIAVITPTQTGFIFSDHLQTPRIVTDTTGNIIWQWTSDGYGAGAPNQDVQNSGTKLELGLRFPGQFNDPETGLYYNVNRYYDSRSGRYITSDPIGLAGGLNTYGYVGGNPVRYVDSTGLDVMIIYAGWAGGLNPFGHLAVGLSNGIVYSYGTKPLDIQGISLKDYLKAQTKNRNIYIGLAKTTVEQDAIIAKSMIPNKKEDYHKFYNTCATVVEIALVKADLLRPEWDDEFVPSEVPATIFPATLFNKFVNRYGNATTIKQGEDKKIDQVLMQFLK